jgi:putative component of membrane protein insertase Oxa1/YidC/SpoIIIJ protein YidD
MEKRKGQSAMEYLMTYGWAILVIIIVIAVLFYIGVLNPRNVTPSSCTFPPGLTCSSYKLHASTAELDLRIGQATGHPIKITGIKCTQESGTPSANITSVDINIPIGEQRWVVGGDSGNTMVCFDASGTAAYSNPQLGEFYKGKIWVFYNEADTGITRTVVGDIATKFEQ